ncbi:MAG: DNA recombination protein RecN [Desulfovibrionaceae bacterium CG1_02_65_16]|nr:MAG: DNA recombination protein RecN [Desulfovibrionaceae bacterium CG1_02_65_16]
MLELLRIRDLALIEDAELEFAPGMNALTGETGAGKSFIVRAIDFLTGEPMSADLVRPGKEKAVVEAVFVAENAEGAQEDVIVRRELSAGTGRSRVYVNDRLGSLETLREMRAGLVLHTSQHGQQKLLQPAFQARILDSFLPEPGLVAERDAALAAVKAVQNARAELAARVEGLSRQREFLEFQRAEISKVDPQPGEEDDLLARKAGLKDRERLDEAKGRALEAMLGEMSLAERAAELARALAQLTAFDDSFEADKDVAEDFRHHLTNLESRVRRLSLDDEGGEDIDAIEARLFELAKLKRKLNKGLDEIVDLGKQVEENLSFLDSCALDARRLAREEAEAAKELGAVLARLNAARRAAANTLCQRLGAELAGLGFSEHARVEFVFEPVVVYANPDDAMDESGEAREASESGEAGEAGAPLTELRGRLFWVPNPGQPPRPLDKIASGGELSRFLLALTGLQAESARPTLIFDEVDAGIGGHTLIRVGERLRELAGRQQMILITHWPQLAMLAERHFQVRKEVVDGLTYTGCARLDEAAIAAELSRMAGGPFHPDSVLGDPAPV